MAKASKRTGLLFVVLTIILVSIAAGVIIFFPYDGWNRDLVRATVGFLAIGVFARLITQMLANEAARKEKHDETLELLRGYAAVLTGVYSGVKRLRRRARALSKRSGENRDQLSLRIVDYRDVAFELCDWQLKCEELVKDLDLFDHVDVDLRASKEQIGRMEKYLNLIVDEMEQTALDLSPHNEDDGKYVAVGNLPALNDLLGDYRASKFRTEFVHTYQASREYLQKAGKT